MGPHTPLFAFFGPDGRALLAGRHWPRPEGDGPGDWVSRNAEFPVRAYPAEDLPYWLDDELWQVELGDPIEPGEHALNAERGRLLRRIGGWDPERSRGFVLACAERTRSRAVEFMRSGRLDERAALLAAATERELVAAGDDVAATTSGIVAELATLTADCVRYAEGADSHGAGAAVAGYIGAHAAGRLADDYDAGAEAERAWQARWLIAALELADSR